MNPWNSARLCLLCSVVLLAGTFGRAQIYDGRLEVNTPYYVSLITGYPVEAVKMVVPTGTVTSVINGNLLAGTNLTTPTPVTLGTVTTGLKVSWTYSAVRMDDGSGTAIVLDVTATPTILGQSAPTTARYIVARPDQVRSLFKDRTAIISQVLQQMYQYYYYTGGYGGGSTGTGTLFSLFPYVFWYNYQPYPGSVSVGPTTFISP